MMTPPTDGALCYNRSLVCSMRISFRITPTNSNLLCICTCSYPVLGSHYADIIRQDLTFILTPHLHNPHSHIVISSPSLPHTLTLSHPHRECRGLEQKYDQALCCDHHQVSPTYFHVHHSHASTSPSNMSFPQSISKLHSYPDPHPTSTYSSTHTQTLTPHPTLPLLTRPTPHPTPTLLISTLTPHSSQFITATTPTHLLFPLLAPPPPPPPPLPTGVASCWIPPASLLPLRSCFPSGGQAPPRPRPLRSSCTTQAVPWSGPCGGTVGRG